MPLPQPHKAEKDQKPRPNRWGFCVSVPLRSLPPRKRSPSDLFPCRSGNLFEPDMDLRFVREKIIAQTNREVLPGKFDSPEATAMLLAIGLQESRFEHGEQIGGPARSFWQFERGGGVNGVLTHPNTARHAHAVCVMRGIAPTKESVYARMLDDDLLGCAFARLLLYSDPDPLPELGHAGAAWECYLRNWRPGKPHERTWGDLYSQALKALT